MSAAVDPDVGLMCVYYNIDERGRRAIKDPFHYGDEPARGGGEEDNRDAVELAIAQLHRALRIIVRNRPLCIPHQVHR